jgi:hypothetical protein
LRNVTRIFHVTSFIATALVLVMVVYCLGTARDLLAIYWGAVTIVAFRFGLSAPEPD